MGFDVAADDPSPRARAPDPIQVNLRQLGHLAGQRACLEPASMQPLRAEAKRQFLAGHCPTSSHPQEPGCGKRRLDVGLGRLSTEQPPARWPDPFRPQLASGSSPFLARIMTRLTESNLVAGRMVDVHDDAVVVRLHLHGGLVGLDVGQDVAFLDRRLQP